MNPEFLQKFGFTMDSISKLNNLVVAFTTREHNFHNNPTYQNADDLIRILAEIRKYYNISIDQVNTMVDVVDTMMNQDDTYMKQNEEEFLSLNRSDVDKLMQEFFTAPIKTRPAPIPPNCGCYANKCKSPQRGHFICANQNDIFILMIVTHYENGIVTAIDPSDQSLTQVRLANDDWTPLPLFIPEKPLRRWEFTKSTRVLSLYPNGSKWTTEFHKAVVKLCPCDRIEDEERGYLLDFGDDLILVPEKFVAFFPDSWQRKVGY